MTIVLATRNRKKVEEISRIFSGADISFLTLDSFPECPDVKEDGQTFSENAVKKAVAVARRTGYPAVADDSGLEVDALGGAPGVFSARFAGEQATDQQNVNKLLSEMKKVELSNRKARFVCCIAFSFPDGTYHTFTGSVEGVIGKEQKGSNGFGYDPVFYPEGHDKTFAEMTDAQKDVLSHRGRALGKFFEFVQKKYKY